MTIRDAIGRFSSGVLAFRGRFEMLALRAKDFDWERESGWDGSSGTPCGV